MTKTVRTPKQTGKQADRLKIGRTNIYIYREREREGGQTDRDTDKQTETERKTSSDRYR